MRSDSEAGSDVDAEMVAVITATTQMDWWGPYAVASVPGSYVYMAVVLDVATGWVQTYFRRTHTAQDTVDVLTLYEGDMGAKLKLLRTDGGSDFVSDAVQLWLAGKAVRWERSTPYVHEEVGQVERRNGMLAPVARTMLLRAQMGLQHWASAMQHAAWLLNRTPDKTRGGKYSTPYWRRFKKLPDLSNLRRRTGWRGTCPSRRTW